MAALPAADSSGAGAPAAPAASLTPAAAGSNNSNDISSLGAAIGSARPPAVAAALPLASGDNLAAPAAAPRAEEEKAARRVPDPADDDPGQPLSGPGDLASDNPLRRLEVRLEAATRVLEWVSLGTNARAGLAAESTAAQSTSGPLLQVAQLVREVNMVLKSVVPTGVAGGEAEDAQPQQQQQQQQQQPALPLQPLPALQSDQPGAPLPSVLLAQSWRVREFIEQFGWTLASSRALLPPATEALFAQPQFNDPLRVTTEALMQYAAVLRGGRQSRRAAGSAAAPAAAPADVGTRGAPMKREEKGEAEPEEEAVQRDDEQDDLDENEKAPLRADAKEEADVEEVDPNEEPEDEDDAAAAGDDAVEEDLVELASMSSVSSLPSFSDPPSGLLSGSGSVSAAAMERKAAARKRTATARERLWVLELLRVLSASPAVQRDAIRSGALPLLVRSLRRPRLHPSCAESCCASLAYLCRDADNARRFARGGGVAAVLAIAERHADSVRVQEAALSALAAATAQSRAVAKLAARRAGHKTALAALERHVADLRVCAAAMQLLAHLSWIKAPAAALLKNLQAVKDSMRREFAAAQAVPVVERRATVVAPELLEGPRRKKRLEERLQELSAEMARNAEGQDAVSGAAALAASASSMAENGAAAPDIAQRYSQASAAELELAIVRSFHPPLNDASIARESRGAPHTTTWFADLALERDACAVIGSALKSAACRLVRGLAASVKSRTALGYEGFIGALVDVLFLAPLDASVAEHGCRALQALVKGHKLNRQEVLESGGSRVLVDMLRRLGRNPAVVSECVGALSRLHFRRSSHRSQLLLDDSLLVLCDALRSGMGNLRLQRSGITLLEELVRYKDTRKALVRAGVRALVSNAIVAHGNEAELTSRCHRILEQTAVPSCCGLC